MYMIKVLFLDCDGIIISREQYFSKRLLGLGLDLNEQKIKEFFESDFAFCKTGKKDLKEELVKWLPMWNLNWSVEKTMDFWFSGEREFDKELVDYTEKIRKQGTKVFVATDNEKYRTRDIWEVAGLNKIVDGVFSSCDIGFLKTDIRFWEEVFRKLPEYKKEEAVFWDHEEEKLEPARSFGILTAYYDTFDLFKKTMEKYLP